MGSSVKRVFGALTATDGDAWHVDPVDAALVPVKITKAEKEAGVTLHLARAHRKVKGTNECHTHQDAVRRPAARQRISIAQKRRWREQKAKAA